MPKLSVTDIRAMDEQKLREELENSYKEQMNLRFRNATKQLTNTSELGNVKKKIAQLRTVIHQRELQRSLHGQREKKG